MRKYASLETIIGAGLLLLLLLSFGDGDRTTPLAAAKMSCFGTQTALAAGSACPKHHSAHNS